MQNKGSELPKEHILVCLSSSPSNERIVRMAGKMAQAFSGSLTALYVQTPEDANMNAEDTARLQVNMRLAQQLGAEIVTTHGEDVATQIAEYVRLSDVTKIVIGRSGVQRRHRVRILPQKRPLRGTFFDRARLSFLHDLIRWHCTPPFLRSGRTAFGESAVDDQ